VYVELRALERRATVLRFAAMIVFGRSAILVVAQQVFILPVQVVSRTWHREAMPLRNAADVLVVFCTSCIFAHDIHVVSVQRIAIRTSGRAKIGTHCHFVTTLLQVEVIADDACTELF
jgi:hypothetical protein